MIKYPINRKVASTQEKIGLLLNQKQFILKRNIKVNETKTGFSSK